MTLPAALATEFCRLVGVQYPVVQTGMGWVSGAKLTAATAQAGGLGILASATMTLPELRTAIASVTAATDRPFGVNLRTDSPDVEDRVRLIIESGVKVASFAQAPGRETIARLKDAGVVTMPTIGARRHAEKVAEWGVDAIIAQGREGGGHTGAVPTSLLIPQCVDAVDIPVIAAGGFFDGRGLVAALAWGAAGIAMGTRFLLTSDSEVPDPIKARYLQASVTDTVVTKAIDGYPQRVIRTEMVDDLESSTLTRLPKAVLNALRFSRLTGTSKRDLVREGLAMRSNHGLTWAQLAMAANAPMLTRASMVEGRMDVGILPTGQGVGVIDTLPSAADVVSSIMEQASGVLARLTGVETRSLEP